MFFGSKWYLVPNLAAKIGIKFPLESPEMEYQIHGTSIPEIAHNAIDISQLNSHFQTSKTVMAAHFCNPSFGQSWQILFAEVLDMQHALANPILSGYLSGIKLPNLEVGPSISTYGTHEEV